MAPSWLCSNISATPAVKPKFPSIWNGGCASKRLGYSRPSGYSFDAASDGSGLMRVRTMA